MGTTIQEIEAPIHAEEQHPHAWWVWETEYPEEGASIFDATTPDEAMRLYEDSCGRRPEGIPADEPWLSVRPVRADDIANMEAEAERKEGELRERIAELEDGLKVVLAALEELTRIYERDMDPSDREGYSRPVWLANALSRRDVLEAARERLAKLQAVVDAAWPAATVLDVLVRRFYSNEIDAALLQAGEKHARALYAALFALNEEVAGG